jgi:hypothetical protein
MVSDQWSVVNSWDAVAGFGGEADRAVGQCALKGMINVKAKIVQAWIHSKEDGEFYEVIVRVDTAKGKFIESVHRRHDEAQARIKFLLRPDTFVEVRNMTPTV